MSVFEYNASTSCELTGIGTPKRAADAFVLVEIGLGTIAGKVVNDVDGDGTADSLEAGLAGASVALYIDTNLDGVFSPDDLQQGSSITTASDGLFSFGSLAVNKKYFLVETNPAGYVSTQAIAGSGDNTTAARVDHDQIAVELFSAGALALCGPTVNAGEQSGPEAEPDPPEPRLHLQRGIGRTEAKPSRAVAGPPTSLRQGYGGSFSEGGRAAPHATCGLS